MTGQASPLQPGWLASWQAVRKPRFSGRKARLSSRKGFPARKPGYPAGKPGFPAGKPGFPAGKRGFPAGNHGYPKSWLSKTGPSPPFEITMISDNHGSSPHRLGMYPRVPQVSPDSLWLSLGSPHVSLGDPWVFLRFSLGFPGCSLSRTRITARL